MGSGVIFRGHFGPDMQHVLEKSDRRPVLPDFPAVARQLRRRRARDGHLRARAVRPRASRLRQPAGRAHRRRVRFRQRPVFRGKLAYARRSRVRPIPACPVSGRRRARDYAECRLASAEYRRDARRHSGRSPASTSPPTIRATAAAPLERPRSSPTRSGPTATSSCSAASPRRSTSTSCWRSSAIACCFRPTSSAAAT